MLLLLHAGLYGFPLFPVAGGASGPQADGHFFKVRQSVTVEGFVAFTQVVHSEIGVFRHGEPVLGAAPVAISDVFACLAILG